MRLKVIAVTVMTATGALSLGSASAATEKIPALYRNCHHLNQKYHHGVGLVHAHDKTNGTPPVTVFLRSDRLYRLAMSYNKRLDRDKDGIACEKL
jgi:hypothetical protein